MNIFYHFSWYIRKSVGLHYSYVIRSGRLLQELFHITINFHSNSNLALIQLIFRHLKNSVFVSDFIYLRNN